jgi:hypothetical protein
MALNILTHQGVGFAPVRGVRRNEIGINVSRFMVRYYPEVNEVIPDLVGNTLWRVCSNNLSRDVQCEGEIVNNTGLMILTVATALSFANDVLEFPGSTGTFYMDEATVTESRNGWVSVSIRASAKGTL